MLETKVTVVKTGTMKKEGYFKNVLNILECHVETRATMSPGKRDARRAMQRTVCLSFVKMGVTAIPQRTALYTFPMRVMRLTTMRMKNLLEKSLVPGKILQGPVFKAFDKPKVAVKVDDAKVTRKKVVLEPMSASRSRSVMRIAEESIATRMVVVGMAS